MRLFHFSSARYFQKAPVGKATFGLIVLFVATGFFAQAQNYPTTPNSLSPSVQPTIKVNKRTRQMKTMYPKVKRSAEYLYYSRVQKAAKTKKRALRKLAKPQYTNPLYFGHKNPPKKREPHNMRFCTECGIRH